MTKLTPYAIIITESEVRIMTQYRVWLKALWNGSEQCIICSIDMVNAFILSPLWEVQKYELIRMEEYL